VGSEFLFLERHIRAYWYLQKNFIEFELVCVETNELVHSNSNVILMWLTCGQRSSRVAVSKRRAPSILFFRANLVCVLDIQCRVGSDLGLCTSSVVSKRMTLRSADIQFKNVFGRRIRLKLALRSGILFEKYRTHAQTYIRLSSTFRYQ